MLFIQLSKFPPTRVGNSLIVLIQFSSDSLVFVSEIVKKHFTHEKECITPVTLLSWATWFIFMRICLTVFPFFMPNCELLPLLFAPSLKQSDMSDSLVIPGNCSQKREISSNKFIFLHIFLTVFPFLCPRANCSRSSLLRCSFVKSDRSDLFSSLFTKEWLWANCSNRSWKKSNREQFAPVTLLDKRVMGVICSFPRANRHFALSLTKNERLAHKTNLKQLKNHAKSLHPIL